MIRRIFTAGMRPSRRDVLAAAAGAAAALACPAAARAQSSRMPFPKWVATFRARALARGISAATYDRVMGTVKPDLSVFEQIRNRPGVLFWTGEQILDWFLAASPQRG